MSGAGGGVDAGGDGASCVPSPEVCNGKDDDCDNQIDNDASDSATWYQDDDGDGFGVSNTTQKACTQPTGYAAQPGDCVDTDANFHPSAPEIDCTDPNDYNCDGSTGYADADKDGVAACVDCNDLDPAIGAC